MIQFADLRDQSFQRGTAGLQNQIWCGKQSMEFSGTGFLCWAILMESIFEKFSQNNQSIQMYCNNLCPMNFQGNSTCDM